MTVPPELPPQLFQGFLIDKETQTIKGKKRKSSMFDENKIFANTNEKIAAYLTKLREDDDNDKSAAFYSIVNTLLITVRSGTGEYSRDLFDYINTYSSFRNQCYDSFINEFEITQFNVQNTERKSSNSIYTVVNRFITCLIEKCNNLSN